MTKLTLDQYASYARRYSAAQDLEATTIDRKLVLRWTATGEIATDEALEQRRSVVLASCASVQKQYADLLAREYAVSEPLASLVLEQALVRVAANTHVGPPSEASFYAALEEEYAAVVAFVDAVLGA